MPTPGSRSSGRERPLTHRVLAGDEPDALVGQCGDLVGELGPGLLHQADAVAVADDLDLGLDPLVARGLQDVLDVAQPRLLVGGLREVHVDDDPQGPLPLRPPDAPGRQGGQHRRQPDQIRIAPTGLQPATRRTDSDPRP